MTEEAGKKKDMKSYKITLEIGMCTDLPEEDIPLALALAMAPAMAMSPAMALALAMALGGKNEQVGTYSGDHTV